MSNNNQQEEAEMAQEQQSNGVLERHFGTIATSLILIAIIWVGNTIMDQGKTQTEMAGTMQVMKIEMKHLKELVSAAANTRFTKQDAQHLITPLEYRIKSLETKLEECRREHQHMEDLHKNGKH